MNTTDLLCIGGPLDGIRHRDYGRSVMEFPLYTDREGNPSGNTVIYRKQLWHTGTREIRFWVSDHMTPDEMLQRLIDSYEEKANMERAGY